MAEGAITSVLEGALARLAIFTTSAYRFTGVDREEVAKIISRTQAIQTRINADERRFCGPSADILLTKMLRDVMYEAEDFYDEVATYYLLKRRVKENFWREVRFLCSHLNSPIYKVGKVKALSSSLGRVSIDMWKFGATDSYEEPLFDIRRALGLGSVVDPGEVFGREDDKEAVLDFLFKDSNNGEENISVIAIVGIGGMGKTTLARLVCSDDLVKKGFDKTWWVACGEVRGRKITEKIIRSMTGKSQGYSNNLDEDELAVGIRQSVGDHLKVLIVLDDVGDSDYVGWEMLKSLLNKGAKRSKMIVTTRDLSVARSMGAVQVYKLDGLLEDGSWKFFKRFAFFREDEDNPEWRSLGRQILKECFNVPLVIQNVASLLRFKTTLREWKSFKDDVSFSIKQRDSPIMSTLRLNYDHLLPDLKQCFAYCSLLPKNFIILKEKLIHLWIAQGYVLHYEFEQNPEEKGCAFLHTLLDIFFFEEVDEDNCKMHDLANYLAQIISDDQCFLMASHSSKYINSPRHIAVGYEVDYTWEIPPLLLHERRARSFLFMGGGSLNPMVLEKIFANFKFLRALDLQKLNLKKVPSSVKKLRHLRYLNLSGNSIMHLPHSISELVNLITLDISECRQLEALPNDFRKLINLRHLCNAACCSLKRMPPGFGELTSLQQLSCFKVSKSADDSKSSRLDVLAGLRLRGGLLIEWQGDELTSEIRQLPKTLKALCLVRCPGARMPSLRPHVKTLKLQNMQELEYLQDDGETNESRQPSYSFPYLKTLELEGLPKFKGLSRKVEVVKASEGIACSPPLRNQAPLFSRLQTLKIICCNGLVYFHGEALTALQHLEFRQCMELKKVCLPPAELNVVKELVIGDCPKLELWEEEDRSLGWNSLPNLCLLKLVGMPNPYRLPDCLQNRQSLSNLQISYVETDDQVSASVQTL